ncbi:MAG: homocysteine S-methyltransferase family protein, partial [Micromonosporaceae bacterium]|nr:homocysteine S-methyltransferase family protein [Micromonosporaceae bacterium]
MTTFPDTPATARSRAAGAQRAPALGGTGAPAAHSFTAALEKQVLVCDGAMGTMLHSAGNSLDRALPELNLTNPDLVCTIHDSYIAAGVDVIQTNSFGANRLRLVEQGASSSVRDINLAAARHADA